MLCYTITDCTPRIRSRARLPPRTLQKLLLWATLVFFKRGSQLQMSGAVLLTTIRLVLHAHFEPYKDAMDNLFDYLTLTVVALNGMCGVLLQVRLLRTVRDLRFSSRLEERVSDAFGTFIVLVLCWTHP